MWHKIFGFNKVLSFVFYIKDILISPADGKESVVSSTCNDACVLFLIVASSITSPGSYFLLDWIGLNQIPDTAVMGLLVTIAGSNPKSPTI
jgi:hypothetical protein